ncbi:unnamed protein product [Prorocentrum cordatum]|uniref:Uncharacterized protein n=1 Tax=Prorocentrum cordatum TaxID=2364126 RepID=A0ABN9VPG0_9DINO|nr:unnamed protein product [Polarella glacialis]
MGLLPHIATASFGAAPQAAVLVGALLGLAASAALLLYIFVFRGLIGQLWNAFASRLQLSDPAMKEEILKRLSSERLHHACCMNIFVTGWCCTKIAIVVANILSGAARWQTFWQDALLIFATFACVLSHVAIQQRQRSSTVTAVYVTFMIWQTLFMSSGPAEQLPFVAAAGFSVLIRGLWSLVCMNWPLVGCLTALHFVCVCAGFARTAASCTNDGQVENVDVVKVFVGGELVGDITILVFAPLWRHFSCLRILHEIQASISQSENEAARSLLNIVCDATVELDGNLQIMDETSRLASLLQHGCDRSLKGVSILQFVVEEDHHMFTDRMSSAGDESVANLFHARVRDGISNVLKMEIFHVPVTGCRLRADSHLIGVREFADVTEGVGTLWDGKRGPTGQLVRASDAPDPPNARSESAGPWSSTSSESSSGSRSSRCQGELVACIDVVSPRWEIKHFAPSLGLFLGAVPHRRARELLRWIKPEDRGSLIGWVQDAYQDMRAQRDEGRADVRAARSFPAGPVCFRPPAVWHVKAKLAYAASITLALPDERDDQSSMARLIFSDVWVVQQSSTLHEL